MKMYCAFSIHSSLMSFPDGGSRNTSISLPSASIAGIAGIAGIVLGLHFPAAPVQARLSGRVSFCWLHLLTGLTAGPGEQWEGACRVKQQTSNIAPSGGELVLDWFSHITCILRIKVVKNFFWRERYFLPQQDTFLFL